MSDYYRLTTDNSKITRGPLIGPRHVDITTATPAEIARAVGLWEPLPANDPVILLPAQRVKIAELRAHIDAAIADGIEYAGYLVPVGSVEFREKLRDHITGGGTEVYELKDAATGDYVYISVTQAQAVNFYNTFKARWQNAINKMRDKYNEIMAAGSLAAIEAITWNG